MHHCFDIDNLTNSCYRFCPHVYIWLRFSRSNHFYFNSQEMSLFVLDTSGNQDLLKSETLSAPKFDVSKQRKLLNELKSSNLSSFTEELKEENEEDKTEYDFFGKVSEVYKIILLYHLNFLVFMQVFHHHPSIYPISLRIPYR